MPEQPAAAQRDPSQAVGAGDAPPPEIEEFIRFCHHRRPTAWPELYDEMCAVAAHREFNGWGHQQLADRGVTLTLTSMPQLAAWVRSTLGGPAESVELSGGVTPGA
jgi:hypothetical protein